MRRVRLLAWMLVLPLAGCGVQNLWRDDTARFEEALPLPPAINEASLKLDTLFAADKATRELWQREFESRREVRALKCLTAGLSLFDDEQDISGKVDVACVKAADDELRNWVQGSRLRLLLGMPPLRPLPTRLPEFITTTDIPGVYGMADASPILVVARERKLEVLDASNDQTIHRNASLDEPMHFLAPSPNGRVFAAGEGSTVVMRDSETGEVLASYTGYRSFAWLDSTSGMLTQSNGNQRTLFDGMTATLSEPKGLSTYTGPVVRINPDPAQFVVPGYGRLARFELKRDGGLQVQLLDQRERGWTGSMNGALVGMPDGGHALIADANGVVVVDTRTLEAREISTGRFNPLEVCALDEPGAALIKGQLREQYSRMYYYVYSLVDDRFAPVEDTRLAAENGAVADCPVRFNALNGVYVKTESGFRRLENVSRGMRYGPNALPAHFAELFQLEEKREEAEMNLRQEQVRRRQEEVRQQQLARAREFPGLPNTSYTEVPVTRARTTPSVDAKDATIEAIGVHEAEGQSQSRRAGAQRQRPQVPVTVLVRRADKPIVLVLGSTEPVTWNLTVMAGAKLAAILLGGHQSSAVIGGGDTRVVRINGHAYQSNSSEYTRLDDEVQFYTGRRIDRFQGDQRGKSYMVGGC